MYNHTREYLHAHTHTHAQTQNRGKGTQNITIKLFISYHS